jgi:hypothetical protein
MKESNLLEVYLVEVNSYKRFKSRKAKKFESFIGMFFWGGFIMLLIKIAFESVRYFK